MREGRELEGTDRIAGLSTRAQPERRRPQVEVIREPNEPDEDVVSDPSAAE